MLTSQANQIKKPTVGELLNLVSHRGFTWKHFESAVIQLDQLLIEAGLEEVHNAATTKETS